MWPWVDQQELLKIIAPVKTRGQFRYCKREAKMADEQSTTTCQGAWTRWAPRWCKPTTGTTQQLAQPNHWHSPTTGTTEPNRRYNPTTGTTQPLVQPNDWHNPTTGTTEPNRWYNPTTGTTQPLVQPNHWHNPTTGATTFSFLFLCLFGGMWLEYMYLFSSASEHDESDSCAMFQWNSYYTSPYSVCVGLGRLSGHLGGHNLEFEVTEVRTVSEGLYTLGQLSWTYLFWSRRQADLSLTDTGCFSGLT